MSEDVYLPSVAGRRMNRSNAAFERAALEGLMREQEKLSPDNALIAVLCDAVRLVREYSDAMRPNQDRDTEGQQRAARNAELDDE